MKIPEFKGSSYHKNKRKKLLYNIFIFSVLLYFSVSITKIITLKNHIKTQQTIITTQGTYINKQERYIKLLQQKLTIRAWVPEITTDLLRGVKR